MDTAIDFEQVALYFSVMHRKPCTSTIDGGSYNICKGTFCHICSERVLFKYVIYPGVKDRHFGEISGS